jgi:flavodoxin
MKALAVYASLYGNTEKIARARGVLGGEAGTIPPA